MAYKYTETDSQKKKHIHTQEKEKWQKRIQIHILCKYSYFERLLEIHIIVGPLAIMLKVQTFLISFILHLIWTS